MVDFPGRSHWLLLQGVSDQDVPFHRMAPYPKLLDGLGDRDWRFLQRFTSNGNSSRAVRVVSVLVDRWNSRHSTKNFWLEFSQMHPEIMRVDKEEALEDDTIRIHLAHPNCPDHVDQYLATRYNILRVTVCRRLYPITDIGDESWKAFWDCFRCECVYAAILPIVLLTGDQVIANSGSEA
jgi:hypothetical protein